MLLLSSILYVLQCPLFSSILLFTTSRTTLAYGQRIEVMEEITELTEDAVFDMYQPNAIPKTIVLLLYAPECPHSSIVYQKLLQVQHSIHTSFPSSNNIRDHESENDDNPTIIDFHKFDVTSSKKDNPFMSDYKDLFEQLNLSSNIPELRIIVTYRLPHTYKINERVYTYPKIVSLSSGRDVKQFILFYYMRYTYSIPPPSLEDYRLSPVVYYPTDAWLKDWLEIYKDYLFYDVEDDQEGSENNHVILFVYQSCAQDKNNTMMLDDFHQTAKHMAQYYHHVLFLQSTATTSLTGNQTATNQSNLEVMYAPFSSSNNVSLFDSSTRSKVYDSRDDSSFSFFLHYHALPLLVNISSTTRPTYSSNTASDYKYSYPSTSYYSGDIKVHTTLFLPPDHKFHHQEAQATINLIKDLYRYSYNLRFYTNHSYSYFFVIPSSDTNQRIIDYFNITSFPTLLITDGAREGRKLDFRLGSSLLRKFYWVGDEHENSNSSDVNASFKMMEFMDLFWENNLTHFIPPDKSYLKEEVAVNSPTTKGIFQIYGQTSFDIHIMQNSNKVLLYIYSSSYCAHVQATLPLLHHYAESNETSPSSIQVMTVNLDKYPIYHPNIDIPYLPMLYYFPDGGPNIKLHPISYGCDSIKNIGSINSWVNLVDALLEDVSEFKEK